MPAPNAGTCVTVKGIHNIFPRAVYSFVNRSLQACHAGIGLEAFILRQAPASRANESNNQECTRTHEK